MSSSPSEHADYIDLQVADTGNGMSLQTQSKVFDPFFSTKSADRGLGLAVHRIVRHLGGTIHFTSELDKGTTFQVLLPSAVVPAGLSGHAISGNAPPIVVSPNSTILVVEDEDSLRQPVVTMLRKAGFVVFEAAQGSSAIHQLRVNGTSTDVILLDMTIPGPSRREVVAEAVNDNFDKRIQPRNASGPNEWAADLRHYS